MNDAMRWLVVLGLIAMALLSHPNARADDALLRGLRAEVAVLLGRPVPQAHIVPTTRADIYARCKCYARALFVSGDVLISDTVDVTEKEGQAVLVHELVHWAQYLVGGTVADCAGWIAREEEAITIERIWRSRHGARLPPATYYTCHHPKES